MKKMFSILLAIVLLFSISLPASALDNVPEKQYNIPGIPYDVVSVRPDVLPNNDKLIIGRSSQLISPKAASVITVYAVYSASQVIITITNTGTNNVDIVYGTVRIGDGRSATFQVNNVLALTTRTATVNINMLQCYENITVEYYAYDEGSTAGPGYVTGHREIPSSLTSYWCQGSFPSVYASLNYHFGAHGAEVNCTNIVSYATVASYYRDQIVYDITHRTPLEIFQIYTITVSPGATPAHKYKFKNNPYYYAILTDAGMWLLSFGK